MKIDMMSSSSMTQEIPTTKSSSKALNQDDFMKLFLTQMKTQSPLKPFDSSDMMQQMSQLTSLSSTQELQKTIQLMNANLGKSQLLSATQLIGKTVAVASDQSPLIENQGLNGSVIVPGNASEITVEIKDKGGNLVKTVNLSGASSGIVDFHWDGMNSENKPMAPDFYSISAKAKIGGNEQAIYTAGNFKINSVTMDRQNSSVILNVDGLGGMDMSDIIKILS